VCFELAARLQIIPRGTSVVRGSWSGVEGETVCHADADRGRALLYVHGGAFCIGSPSTHRSLAAHLSRACRAPVHLPDYRLAPEHPHPAAVEDVLAAYRALLAQGMSPARLAVGGDSAGGCLTLMAMVAAREQGLPMPAALVLLSPAADFRMRGATLKTHAAIDPLIRNDWIVQALAAYTGAGPVPPSPVDADLAGLPPMLIQVGSDEVLLSDSERVAERARGAGVDARYERYDGLWHVFQAHAGMMREADQAVEKLGAFLREQWDASGN
jgi:acetyl esterase/lipase